MKLKPRYHVEGQTSSEGARWCIWDNVDGHFARFKDFHSSQGAVAVCEALNEHWSARTLPLDGDVVERVAAALEKAWLAGYGPGERWEHLARAAITATRSGDGEQLAEQLEALSYANVNAPDAYVLLAAANALRERVAALSSIRDKR